MKKRAIVFLMILSVLLTVLTGCSGCSGCGAGTVEKSGVTRGEWISMLGRSFGLSDYQTATAFFSDVSEDDEIYKYVQACAERGILDGEGSLFKPSEYATREFACTTAARAAGFEYEGDLTEALAEQGVIKDTSPDYLNGSVTVSEAKTVITWAKAPSQNADNASQPENGNSAYADEVETLSSQPWSLAFYYDSDYYAYGVSFDFNKDGGILVTVDKEYDDGTGSNYASLSGKYQITGSSSDRTDIRITLDKKIGGDGIASGSCSVEILCHMGASPDLMKDLVGENTLYLDSFSDSSSGLEEIGDIITYEDTFFQFDDLYA